MREIFDQMREEQPEYKLKSLSENPTEAGTYAISIKHIRSAIPMTLKFDGLNWEKEGLDSAMKDADGDITKISYYEKVLTKKIKNKM